MPLTFNANSSFIGNSDTVIFQVMNGHGNLMIDANGDDVSDMTIVLECVIGVDSTNMFRADDDTRRAHVAGRGRLLRRSALGKWCR